MIQQIFFFAGIVTGGVSVLLLCRVFYRAKLRAQQQLFDTRQQDADRHAAELEKLRIAQGEQLKLEIKALSEKIFEEKSVKLNAANKEQLAALIDPFKEKLQEFKKSVDESRGKNIELHTALRTELARMMTETGKLGNEAKMLTTALRGEQKTQGDWGEMILDDLLSRSGLKNGVHYECQKTMRGADGVLLKNETDNLLRPDVIVHYPDGRDVVIDSKVSLTNYVVYMNEENEEKRAEALKNHLKSVRAHVDELAKKNYAAFVPETGRESCGFTVMFIPNEGSFQLAMIHDPGLWVSAFKQKILIVSPVNLMALLQLIEIAWTREDQSRNQQEILKTGAQLLERLYAFYEEFDAIGRQLDQARNAFDNAAHRLKEGERTRSVVSAGEKLKKLGVKMGKEKALPKNLELPESGEM